MCTIPALLSTHRAKY